MNKIKLLKLLTENVKEELKEIGEGSAVPYPYKFDTNKEFYLLDMEQYTYTFDIQEDEDYIGKLILTHYRMLQTLEVDFDVITKEKYSKGDVNYESTNLGIKVMLRVMSTVMDILKNDFMNRFSGLIDAISFSTIPGKGSSLKGTAGTGNRQRLSLYNSFVKKNLEVEKEVRQGESDVTYILKEPLVSKGVNEGEKGLWANIRAKRERGEKPSHPNSKAYKDAVKAGRRINKRSLQKEEINASEAHTVEGSLETVIQGKRNVGAVPLGSTSNNFRQTFYDMVEKYDLGVIKVPSNPYGYYIFYRKEAEADAKELRDIAERYDGYLAWYAEEEDSRRIGEILGYKKQDIEDYIERNRKMEVKEIVEPADPSEVDPKELSMGIDVEMEHTDSRKEAKVIALQHLAEDPKYYTKLKSLNL